MLNQRELIQSFLTGEIVNAQETPEHIETTISHVFLFREKVYKLYKNDNYDFNTHFRDIANGASRKNFYETDFRWNHYFSPNIYRRLVKIYRNDGKFTLVKSGSAVDIAIEMDRVDNAVNLTKLLRTKKVSRRELVVLSETMMRKIKLFPDFHPKLSYSDYLRIRLDSLDAFMKIIPGTLPYQRRQHFMNIQRTFFEEHWQYFASFRTHEMSIAIDNHADNIFIVDHKPQFIDVYSPKEEWGIIEPLFNVARLAADVALYHSQEYGRAVLTGFRSVYPQRKIQEEIFQFYALQAALIKGTYLFLLGDPTRKREAEQYWKTLEKYALRGKIV